jgi:SAM-dependent methyltransferase
MKSYLLSVVKEVLPPFILKLLLNFKKKFNKAHYVSSPKNQKLDLYYDKEMAKILDTWGERNAWIEVQHIFSEKKGKILDIACGTGKVIQILSKNQNLDIYGCDISPYLIDKAKKKNIDDNKLTVCDATQLPYELNFFDYCYSIGSLEHFTKPGIVSFLKSSAKVTKGNGYHMIPVSRSCKNHGWIENYQSYFNNSISWWELVCDQASLDYHFVDSSWEDEISVGKWLVVRKK